MHRMLASVLAVVAFAPVLPAQSQPTLMAQSNMVENCNLRIRVRTQDERPIQGMIQVELIFRQTVIATVHVSGGDQAEFRVANGKEYRLRVSGSGIEVVTTPYFEVSPLEVEHTETVLVKLDPNQQPGQSPQGQGSISASELNIPKNAGAEMKKGLDAYAKADMEAATAHFLKAVAEYPHFARAYDLLGAIAIKEPDRAKAREYFSKSIQADATYFPAFVDLARMDVQDRHYAEAEDLLNKAISMNPASAEAMALLATTEFANNEYDKALTDVQRTHALRDHETYAEVHLLAGKVLRMQHRPEEAIQQFQLFLKEKPDSPQSASAREALASLDSEPQP